jgi:L-seryl-tRNA(Ser) seleniumtransferase
MSLAFRSVWNRLSRRDLVRAGGLLAAAPAWLRRSAAAAPASITPGLRVGPDIYQSVGIRPFINCRGTLTVMGGSLELPEVRAAKEAAALHFVQLDEMMEAIGARLAELTGAEWGVVTSGCAAALEHATAACVAGGNPDLHVRIPNLAGFPKDEVIIPKQSRNVYDAAVRAVGVRILEPETTAELEAALGPRVAMVYVFAGPAMENGPLPYDDIYRLARLRSVPVLVDAAAEMLTIPSVHLLRGATLVGYSGGKCIRGPQCAGLLLGRKDLVKAAWVHSAPHHGYGRATKVGKEEAMGMLAAVEAWVKRDHNAEYSQWTAWMDHIAKRVSAIEGVEASIREPRGLSNHTPTLAVRWDTTRLGITGEEVSNILYTSEPRVALNAGGGFRNGGGKENETGVSIIAYMMSPGEEKIVADRLHAVLSGAPKTPRTRPEAKPPATDLSGQWDVHIDFAACRATHTFYLRQESGRLQGTHEGEYGPRDAFGSIDGDTLRLMSSVAERRHGDALNYRFTGKVSGDSLEGALDLGEYLSAKWSATRHQFRRGA